ncbi:MAG: caspase family protein [Clostridium sp.]
MRKALCIGLNYYGTEHELKGCVEDATKIANLLKRHENGDKNFDLMLEVDKDNSLNKKSIEQLIQNLCAENSTDMDIVLFYFSGHGSIGDNKGSIALFNKTRNQVEYLEMSYLLNSIIHSKAKNKVVILDCCYSGKMGTNEEEGVEITKLPQGTTILTACRSDESSYETEGKGIFSELLSFALLGEAKNILGEVTAASVYSYIDNSLLAWDQRPIFKTNISKSVILRKTEPQIDINILRELPFFFKDINYKYKLAPEYEQNIDKDVDLSKFPNIDKNIKPDSEKIKIFKKFQLLNRLGMLKPTTEEHMFYCALNNDTCELTAIGHHYWRLAKKEKI